LRGNKFNAIKKNEDYGKMDELNYDIVGDDMQAVKFDLTNGQKLRAEAGAMLYLTEGVSMETSTGGGVMKGLKRALTGESFFITTFECTSSDAQVAFSGPHPGKIIPVEISADKTILCQRDSYLCSTDAVEVSIALTKKLGAGLFGGEGFILQNWRARARPSLTQAVR